MDFSQFGLMSYGIARPTVSNMELSRAEASELVKCTIHSYSYDTPYI